MATKEVIKQGVERYLGAACEIKEAYDDPRVPGCCAFRVALQGGETVDFLLNAGERPHKTPEDVASHLEEAMFKYWPPRSGELRFFV